MHSVVPSPEAVRLSDSEADLDGLCARCLTLLCPAGLAGVPQVPLPVPGLPVPIGPSLIGPAGSDGWLVELAGLAAQALQRED